MVLDEIIESEGFWILAGAGVGLELLGWIVGRNAGMPSFPIWQLLIIIAGTIVASAFWVKMLQ